MNIHEREIEHTQVAIHHTFSYSTQETVHTQHYITHIVKVHWNQYVGAMGTLHVQKNLESTKDLHEVLVTRATIKQSLTLQKKGLELRKRKMCVEIIVTSVMKSQQYNFMLHCDLSLQGGGCMFEIRTHYLRDLPRQLCTSSVYLRLCAY